MTSHSKVIKSLDPLMNCDLSECLLYIKVNNSAAPKTGDRSRFYAEKNHQGIKYRAQVFTELHIKE